MPTTSSGGVSLGFNQAIEASIAGVRHYFTHSGAKALADLLEGIDGDIGFAAFDGTVVGSVHPDFIREALLAVALRFPPAAEGVPNPSTAAYCHAATRYSPSCFSSTVL
jgi:hypothetical protein